MMKPMALAIGFVLLAVAASPMAQAHEYRFNCKNLLNAGQLVKVPAVDRKQATIKLKSDKEYVDFNNCQYLGELRDDRKPEEKQNSWGSKILNHLDKTLKTPPPQPTAPKEEMP